MAGLAGRTLGRYEIINLLGSGGMGEVYRARDTSLGRLVAIKVMGERVTSSKRSIERFKREAKTVAHLSHPNILEIHDFGQEGDTLFAVTELLEGGDLRARMRGSRLPVSKAVEIGTAVAHGLAAAHDRGIVHRDIKPENVFVTATGQAKILDFGLAGLKEATAGESAEMAPAATTQTLTGQVLGTAGYMSPEQVRGETLDGRSDIFSLGCVLYEMLAGRRAFRADNARDVMLAVMNADPEPIAGVPASRPAGPRGRDQPVPGKGAGGAIRIRARRHIHPAGGPVRRPGCSE